MTPVPTRPAAVRTVLRATAGLAVALLATAGLFAAQPAVAGVPAGPAAARSTTVLSCATARLPGTAACLSLLVARRNQPGVTGPTGDGYGPANLQSAYKLPSGTAGVGRKVAVIAAYNDPDAAADLAAYRKAWGQAACNTSTKDGCLTVTNQNGKTSPLPSNAGDSGWATEESLGVDMISAICPKCHIYLVEAKSASIANLGTAVNSAVSVLDAKFVSNGYGGTDSSSDTSYDTKYYDHPGVALVAPGSGTSTASYPASSQYVTAAGGTTLTKAAGTTRGWKESAWGSGPACTTCPPPATPTTRRWVSARRTAWRRSGSPLLLSRTALIPHRPYPAPPSPRGAVGPGWKHVCLARTIPVQSCTYCKKSGIDSINCPRLVSAKET